VSCPLTVPTQPGSLVFCGGPASCREQFNEKEFVMAKTTCPLATREEFRTNAQPVTVKINDIPLQAVVKEFSTGSLGWYLNGKTVIDVGGKPTTVQIGMNLTIVGSKELPKEAVAAA
jgi:hypothetical protein